MNVAKRFHRDEGGTITFFTVVAALALTVLIGLVVNTGIQARTRIRMQDAADASAQACGAWVARGLNVTAAANTLQTQLLGVIIIGNALDYTYNKSPACTISQTIQSALQSCMGTIAAPFCLIPWIVYTLETYVNCPIMKVFSQGIYALTKDSPGILWKAMKGLEMLSAGARPAFSALALYQGRQVAILNGAESGFAIPSQLVNLQDPSGMTNALSGLVTNVGFLPTAAGEFKDLCGPTWDSPTIGHTALHGYPDDEGPALAAKYRLMKVPFLNPIMGPTVSIFFFFTVDAQYNVLCKGADPSAPQSVSVPRKVQTMTECTAAGGKAKWLRETWLLKGPTHEPYIHETNVYPQDGPTPSWDPPTAKPTFDPSSTAGMTDSERAGLAGEGALGVDDADIQAVRAATESSEEIVLDCGSFPSGLTEEKFSPRGSISSVGLAPGYKNTWSRTYSEPILVEPARDAGPDAVGQESPATPDIYWDRYRMEYFALMELNVDEEYPVENPMAGSDAVNNPQNRPRPYLLTKAGDELAAALKFVAGAGRTAARPWTPRVFATDAADSHVAFATAEVYNGVVREEGEPDDEAEAKLELAFAQDWRVRLVPTDPAAGSAAAGFVRLELGGSLLATLEELGGSVLGAGDILNNH